MGIEILGVLVALLAILVVASSLRVVRQSYIGIVERMGQIRPAMLEPACM